MHYKRRDAMCAPDAVVDYSFHVAIKDVDNGLIDGISECVAFGVPSFKVFMVYDFGVTDGVFFKVLQKAREAGARLSGPKRSGLLFTSCISPISRASRR